MRKYLFIFLTATGLLFNNFIHAQSKSTNPNLTAIEFSEKMKMFPAASVVDVRTPEEYVGGHLQNALNYDWRGNDFQKQISTLDKSKPVFVYCHSGGRSALATKQMRLTGFEKVYELTGGIMKWREAYLPETIE